jgi:3',5'-cyclic AMP phosphodiesterase CpdA
MNSRRKWIADGLAGLTGIFLLPSVNSFAQPGNNYRRIPGKQLLLRFALASDMHFGQPDTDFETMTKQMMGWLNDDHDKNHLDFVVINGDLVHDRPDLLVTVRKDYLEKLKIPYYTIPGNHDMADAQVWTKAFGYTDNYTIDRGDTGFVLANTADTRGNFLCPDLEFLKKSLERFREKKTVFVVLHIAPKKWVNEDPSIDCPEVIRLLHSYPNVKATFHGHDHLMDGVRYSDKLPHFFDSHIGGDWGTAYRGYRIVELTEDHSIYTYQVNASQNPVLNHDHIG